MRVNSPLPYLIGRQAFAKPQDRLSSNIHVQISHTAIDTFL